MICPVCKESIKIKIIKKRYKFSNGFSAGVLECKECKARFIYPFKVNQNVYEKLHQGIGIYSYKSAISMAGRCTQLYNQKKVQEYKKLLCSTEKFKFVIDYVENNIKNKEASFLEVGCGRGNIMGYFLLKNRKIKGIDISQAAVDSCNKNFGPFFECADLRKWENYEKFDVVYHLGLIGVLDYPKIFLKECIHRLKPNAVMLFNVPNKHRRIGVWVDTMPPDLRSIFDIKTIFRILKGEDIDVYIKIGINGKFFTEKEIYKQEFARVIEFFNKKGNQYNIFVIVKKRGKNDIFL